MEEKRIIWQIQEMRGADGRMETEALAKDSFSDEDRKRAKEVFCRLHSDVLVAVKTEKGQADQFSADARAYFRELQRTEKTGLESGPFEGRTTLSEDYTNLMTIDVLPNSDVPVIGSMIRALKRLHRKLLFWYLKPVFERQSRINMELTDRINELTAENRELREIMNGFIGNQKKLEALNIKMSKD